MNFPTSIQKFNLMYYNNFPQLFRKLFNSFLFIPIIASLSCSQSGDLPEIGNESVQIRIQNTGNSFWTYRLNNSSPSMRIVPPQFEIDGKLVRGILTSPINYVA